jgi:hypothetical protein
MPPLGGTATTSGEGKGMLGVGRKGRVSCGGVVAVGGSVVRPKLGQVARVSTPEHPCHSALIIPACLHLCSTSYCVCEDFSSFCFCCPNCWLVEYTSHQLTAPGRCFGRSSTGSVSDAMGGACPAPWFGSGVQSMVECRGGQKGVYKWRMAAEAKPQEP